MHLVCTLLIFFNIHHHRWREKATDTFTPFPAPVVYKVSVSMRGGFLHTTGTEADHSAVNFAKEAAPPLYKSQSSILSVGGKGVVGWEITLHEKRGAFVCSVRYLVVPQSCCFHLCSTKNSLHDFSLPFRTKIYAD